MHDYVQCLITKVFYGAIRYWFLYFHILENKVLFCRISIHWELHHFFFKEINFMLHNQQCKLMLCLFTLFNGFYSILGTLKAMFAIFWIFSSWTFYVINLFLISCMWVWTLLDKFFLFRRKYNNKDPKSNLFESPYLYITLLDI